MTSARRGMNMYRLTDDETSFLKTSLEVARDAFFRDAETLYADPAHRRMARQFALQREQAQGLLDKLVEQDDLVVFGAVIGR